MGWTALLLVLTAEPPQRGAKAAAPVYDFQLANKEDTVVARQDGNRTVFLITSPGGIGRATISLKAGQWPKDVTFRFVYGEGKGFTNLEDFCLTADRLEVVGMGGRQIGAKTMPVYRLDEAGKPSPQPVGQLPVRVEERNGAVEVTLPADLLAGSGKVRLSWINAYRR
jgi:hypothetical protein